MTENEKIAALNILEEKQWKQIEAAVLDPNDLGSNPLRNIVAIQTLASWIRAALLYAKD
jgi:hypothetical protein